ncbi:MAG TPA: anthranilate phosphoribosyltransferase [Polyangiales bacterium]|nr:anthranilate phosphoribosyltransferase [Polyangiales bacterium]
MIKEAIATAAAGREVPTAVMERAMEALFTGEATPSQIGALLVALRMKGETAGEISASARVMRRHCVPVKVSHAAVLDTCGTGGDGSLTFNISTAASLVVAGAGVPVAKHGNRAASSKTGSADVLEQLGVNVELPAAAVERCIEQCGIGFMFARLHHPAMRHVAATRAEIGVRTLFNFLGPLCNPASASHQLIGVPEPRLCEMLARVLGDLDTTRSWVVCGDGNVDEIALSGPTRVAQIDRGKLEASEVTPEDFGVQRQPLESLKVEDVGQSAAVIRAVLAGERGPRRDVVVINAAAALFVAERVGSLREGAAMAAESIDSGAAQRKLEAWSAQSKAG